MPNHNYQLKSAMWSCNMNFTKDLKAYHNNYLNFILEGQVIVRLSLTYSNDDIWYISSIGKYFKSRNSICISDNILKCLWPVLFYPVKNKIVSQDISKYIKQIKLGRNLRLLWQWRFNLWSGLWHHIVMWQDTIVSDDHAASMFRANWRWRQHGPLNRWYPTTSLLSITTQQTTTWIFTAMKTKSHSRYNSIWEIRVKSELENHNTFLT